MAQIARAESSLVEAYCETRTLSRNAADASNNYSVGSLTCEPVSGFCPISPPVRPALRHGLHVLPQILELRPLGRSLPAVNDASRTDLYRVR